MEIRSEIRTIGNNSFHGKVVEETFYDPRTHDSIIKILEAARKRNYRLRIYYGNTEASSPDPNASLESNAIGRQWGNNADQQGYISRSTGPLKVPICVYNRRCLGGASILTHCIVKIEYANKRRGGVLYKHPKYKSY